MFSGGLDSTYLMYSALKRGYTVYPIVGNILGNVSKNKRENQVRSKLYSLFRKEFSNQLQPELRAVGIDLPDTETGIHQSNIWIISILHIF